MMKKTFERTPASGWVTLDVINPFFQDLIFGSVLEKTASGKLRMTSLR